MNILPKKSWHVFKPENVEKVLKDEAAARGKEAERFEAELEAQKDLRKARLLSLQADGSHTAQKFTSPGQAPAVDKPSKSSTVSHLNLFEGADFDIGSKAQGSRRSYGVVDTEKSAKLAAKGHPEFEKEAAAAAARAVQREGLHDVAFGKSHIRGRDVEPWYVKAPQSAAAAAPRVDWSNKRVQRAVGRLNSDRRAEDPLTSIQGGVKSLALLQRIEQQHLPHLPALPAAASSPLAASAIPLIGSQSGQAPVTASAAADSRKFPAEHNARRSEKRPRSEGHRARDSHRKQSRGAHEETRHSRGRSDKLGSRRRRGDEQPQSKPPSAALWAHLREQRQQREVESGGM